MSSSIRATLIALLFTTALPGGALGQTDGTFLHLDSAPGDYIGQGEVKTLRPADGTFSASRNFDNGITIIFNGADEDWRLEFAAPLNAALAPGTYEGAMRFPFQDSDEPGLDVSGNSRGCNELSGRFVVLEAEYGTSGEVEKFAADFEQHCEHAPAALLGSIRFNSGFLNMPCGSGALTIDHVQAEIDALDTNAASKTALSRALDAIDEAIADEKNKQAREKLASLIKLIIAKSNLNPNKAAKIEVAEANHLVCSTANLLQGITVP